MEDETQANAGPIDQVLAAVRAKKTELLALPNTKLNAEERAELAVLLSSGPVCKLLAGLLQEGEGVLSYLQHTNMAQAGAIAVAAQYQGTFNGLARAVDLFITSSMETPND